jgi:pimeloyl-ACP methyl ester carboxylesterase
MEAMTLRDGRRQAYERMGRDDGFPVVLLHGTPGSSRQLRALDRPAREEGIAVIAPDRAGYGGSAFDPGRTVGSSARDIGELIKHIGLGRCGVVGISGGGPTALACSVLIPLQVTTVATVGSPAPLVPRNPSLPPDRFFVRTARRSETAVRGVFSVMVHAGRLRPEKALDRLAAQMAESDRGVLRDESAFRAAMLDDLRYPSRTAAQAAARDFRLFALRWDVDLADSEVPVQVWHGDHDRNVPAEHARVIASVCPKAQLHIVEGGGHMLLDQLDEILTGMEP